MALGKDERWTWAQGPGLAVVLFVSVTMVGTLGYMLLLGWDPWDAFYMTIISVTTVGYRRCTRWAWWDRRGPSRFSSRA